MTTDLAVPTTLANGVQLDHEGILRSLNLNARDPKVQAMLLVCERYGIDPLMKHAVLISGNIYITRDGYLHVAHRSGQFDGIEVLETDETPTHYTAKVAVHRKDMRHPFTYTGRFPKAERMAKTFGPEMAVKVAEVQALRRAFNVTGVSASDERWDVDPAEVVHAVANDEPKALEPPANVEPETGEVTEPTPLTRRRPPPVASRVPCPADGCSQTFVTKLDAVPHLVSDHEWVEDEHGKVSPAHPGESGEPSGGHVPAAAGSSTTSPAASPAGGTTAPGAVRPASTGPAPAPSLALEGA